jgi:phosphatidylglycerophosphatase A
MRAILLAIASGGFIGYIPVASGTFGSMVAIPLFWLIDPLQRVSTPGYLMVYVVLVLGACWVAGKAEALLQEHDSHKIVIDEIVGYLGATLFLQPTWRNALVAFLIFRVLDVVKPFPAGYVDRRLTGGFGVVLDDVISGIYSNIATRLVLLAI